MNELKTCPVCNGQGFLPVWDNDKTPPALHLVPCARCGECGSVKEVET